MKAFIHVNAAQVRQGHDGITIRITEPLVGGEFQEMGVYRCRELSWGGPTVMIHDDDNRLASGPRVWIEIDADDIEWVDRKLPPWLPEPPDEEHYGEDQERRSTQRDHPSNWRPE